MIARIYSVHDDRLYIGTGDPVRARQRGRQLIPIRDSGSAGVLQPVRMQP